MGVQGEFQPSEGEIILIYMTGGDAAHPRGHQPQTTQFLKVLLCSCYMDGELTGKLRGRLKRLTQEREEHLPRELPTECHVEPAAGVVAGRSPIRLLHHFTDCEVVTSLNLKLSLSR